MLPVDLALNAGDIGESLLGGRGAKNGRLAASGFIFGGALRKGFGAGIGFESRVGARTRVFGSSTGWLCCNGEGTWGAFWPLAFIWRSVKGLLRLAG